MYFSAEGGILLAEGPAVLGVVDGRSVEEMSALEWQAGGSYYWAQGSTDHQKILLVVVCKFQRTMEWGPVEFWR